MQTILIKTSAIHGRGVFAARSFHEGEIILEIDDSHIVEDESTLTKEDWEFNVDCFDGKTVIMQEPERSINHSCDPNSYTRTVDGVRKVIARRDIVAGEELTYDFTINGDNEGAFPCHCGAKRCRGTYLGDFFKLPLEFQIEYLPYLEVWFVEQHRDRIAALMSSQDGVGCLISHGKE
ncbi:MAG: SET domain protein [Chloroflexi bacterium ADurb.Bin360]|nr:MAG: SET domain protein [Chloroflexi bacterium ADurb.Bin360]